MKKMQLFKRLFYCFLTLFLVSCSSIAQSQQEKRPVTVDGIWSVQSDLVEFNQGCYTVNVRVYLTYNGQTLLMANSNVQVGSCTNKLGNNLNSECKDQEFKGDYFFYSKDNYKYCLVELLQDDVIYAKYVIEKNRVIDSTK